ncbi:hypothetical protein LF599_07620 [Pseudodesulfovibrio thermohalotolerans]|uniref:hypothetical protein n=1 Tax=Pseudodesulfovibrio thermohalotolerans TaxID=2880651 RepID=UPI0022BA03BD|nr:hypothetical protein [Pseudodesulfovibrio thermohalotolerans]WFS64023.1 hypothetical protein LF599_07620 [Pseudodesulfovibrio thermohalotolerans]
MKKHFDIRQQRIDAFNEARAELNAKEFNALFGNKRYSFDAGIAWVVDWSGEWSASFRDGEIVANFDGRLPLKVVMKAIEAMGSAF